MDIRFLGQPFDSSEQIGSILLEALDNPALDKFWLVTAWGKQSGLSRMLVGILGSVAEWERATIRQRTRDALAAKKAAGARLGRPVSPASRPARTRLRELLHAALPLAAIADILNDEGYTTSTGLQWTWRHVQKTRDSLAPDDLAAAAL